MKELIHPLFRSRTGMVQSSSAVSFSGSDRVVAAQEDFDPKKSSVAPTRVFLTRLSRDEDCNYPGIEKTPGICGGDARIKNTRIPVWGLVRSKELVKDDERLLEAYPNLTMEDLKNAWNYYHNNYREIDNSIAENEKD